LYVWKQKIAKGSKNTAMEKNKNHHNLDFRKKNVDSVISAKGIDHPL
jgi:hypothetical protein